MILTFFKDYKYNTEEYLIETIFGLQSLEHFFIYPSPWFASAGPVVFLCMNIQFTNSLYYL